MKAIIKIIDVVVFAGLFILAFEYYAENPSVFDVITIVALVYVALRNPDVNTVTLISLILIERAIDSTILYFIGDQNLSAYIYYPMIAAINAGMLFLVVVRPVLLSRYGPEFLREHKRLTMTHQDAMIAWLYFAFAALPILTLIEHIIRHLDDVTWSPMFFYNLYQPAQLVLGVLAIMVLYFMTFEKSKEARDARKREAA